MNYFSLKHALSPLRACAVVFTLCFSAINAQAAPSATEFTHKAVVVVGHSFPPTQTIAGQTLGLNGAGVRQFLWLQGFTAALYLQAPARSEAELMRTTGPRRLRLIMMQEAPTTELSKAINKGIPRNTPADENTTLTAPRLEFARTIELRAKVKKGDIVDLDFIPNEGLVLNFNGKQQGQAINNEALYLALLRSFVGKKPYDDKLKASLLGLPTNTPTP